MKQGFLAWWRCCQKTTVEVMELRTVFQEDYSLLSQSSTGNMGSCICRAIVCGASYDLEASILYSFHCVHNSTTSTVVLYIYIYLLMWNPGSLSSIRISFYGHVWSLMKTQFLWCSQARVIPLTRAPVRGKALVLYTTVFLFVSFYDHKHTFCRDDQE